MKNAIGMTELVHTGDGTVRRAAFILIISKTGNKHRSRGGD